MSVVLYLSIVVVIVVVTVRQTKDLPLAKGNTTTFDEINEK